jgi:hypothetical protein
MIGREVIFITAIIERQIRKRHDASTVDQDIEAPPGGEETIREDFD